jgi:hypothetical protein
MKSEVYSIPEIGEKKIRWPKATDFCPRCGKPFGTGKKLRLKDGTVVHKACARSK